MTLGLISHLQLNQKYVKHLELYPSLQKRLILHINEFFIFMILSRVASINLCVFVTKKQNILLFLQIFVPKLNSLVITHWVQKRPFYDQLYLY